MTCPDCQSPNDEAAEVCFTCGKRLVTEPTAITRGALVAARYEILSPLGRGGTPKPSSSISTRSASSVAS